MHTNHFNSVTKQKSIFFTSNLFYLLRKTKHQQQNKLQRFRFQTTGSHGISTFSETVFKSPDKSR